MYELILHSKPSAAAKGEKWLLQDRTGETQRIVIELDYALRDQKTLEQTARFGEEDIGKRMAELGGSRVCRNGRLSSPLW